MVNQTCLLMLFGLPRTFEECSNNINNFLIDKNRLNYDFTLIISTDREGKEHEKWKDPKRTSNYLNISILEDKLNKCYSNIKKILYLSGPSYHFSPSGDKIATIMYDRLIQMLYNERKQTYDYYIFSRLDIILFQPIYLSSFHNKFSMITRGPQLGGGGLFYNRDFDYMWIGSKVPFLIWCINMLKYCDMLKSERMITLVNELCMNDTFLIKEIESYKNIDKITIKNNIFKHKIIPDFGLTNNNRIYRYDYVKMFHYLINYLERNGFEFEIGKNFTKLVR